MKADYELEQYLEGHEKVKFRKIFKWSLLPNNRIKSLATDEQLDFIQVLFQGTLSLN